MRTVHSGLVVLDGCRVLLTADQDDGEVAGGEDELDQLGEEDGPRDDLDEDGHHLDGLRFR